MEILRFRRKLGLGCHRFRVGGSLVIVKGGQTVVCSREDIGQRFNIDLTKSQYECLDKTFSEAKIVARVPEVVPNEKAGWYDVVNPDYPDRPLNDKKMRKKTAIEFLESFSS